MGKSFNYFINIKWQNTKFIFIKMINKNKNSVFKKQLNNKKTVLKPTQVDKFSKLRYRIKYVEGTRQNDSVSLWIKSDFIKLKVNIKSRTATV
jgi:hypothetical protein